MKHVVRDNNIKEFVRGPYYRCTNFSVIFGSSCGGSYMLDNWPDDVRI